MGSSWCLIYKTPWFWRVQMIADWNLLCFGVCPTTFSQTDVSILASFQLADCVDKWFSTPKRVCLLKLQLKGKRLCFNQKSESKTSHYDNFAIRIMLLCRKSNQSESTMLTGDFNFLLVWITLHREV